MKEERQQIQNKNTVRQVVGMCSTKQNKKAGRAGERLFDVGLLGKASLLTDNNIVAETLKKVRD